MDIPFHPNEIRGILACLLSTGADYAEVFVEHRQFTDLEMGSGRNLARACVGTEIGGVAIRVRKGAVTRMATQDSFDLTSIRESAKALVSSLPGTPEDPCPVSLPDLPPLPPPRPLSPTSINPVMEPPDWKLSIMARAANLTRRYIGEEIHRLGEAWKGRFGIGTGYYDHGQDIWIATAERDQGEWRTGFARDHRVQARLKLGIYIKLAGEENWITLPYMLTEPKGHTPFAQRRIDGLAREAAQGFRAQATAREAPLGLHPILLDRRASKVLVHELGHMMEADTAILGTMPTGWEIGQKIAGDKVTIFDEGSLPYLYGSAEIDDEGCEPRKTVLIENGVLVGLLHSRETAAGMGAGHTGSGRRESFETAPQPRMRNTLLEAGASSPDEMLRGLDRGILVLNAADGHLLLPSGSFSFKVFEAYWVENGVPLWPLKPFQILGNGQEALLNMACIGHDLDTIESSWCGKYGDIVPIACGGPSILLPGMETARMHAVDDGPEILGRVPRLIRAISDDRFQW